MRIWNRLARKAGEYWRLTLFPVGTVINAWGNSYYDTPYRYLGLLPFFAGGAIALYGAKVLNDLPLWDVLAVRLGTPRWRHLRGNLRLLLGAAVPLAFLHHARFSIGRVVHGVAQPSDFELAAGALFWIWIMLSVGGSNVEPKDSPFERLPGRITRAARVRVLANWAGVAAAALYFYPRLLSAYPAQTVSLGATFAVALVVVMHKVYARVRKLCTQVHAASQSLRRDLDELAAADPAAPATGPQSAARRSWDTLSRSLHTRLDSGYPRFGVAFLREMVVADLEARVLAAIDAMPGEPDAAKQVHEDLAAIIRACDERIDVVA
ncbi:hypothetical protein OG196_32030 [Kitasatospora purpeofusca]|uniref:hypothetical protein n=1 Tax=Kitasatospora purpeofusca TaxID=67352 RepID=UPI002E0E5FFA|nr:hypothetical protein OG196_32030 [Kitasatospora purpeofusca]